MEKKLTNVTTGIMFYSGIYVWLEIHWNKSKNKLFIAL